MTPEDGTDRVSPKRL